jgi:hypothetical protein
MVRMMCLVDRERDMRFAQDDNLFVGSLLGTQLAVCTTQNDRTHRVGFCVTFSLVMYLSPLLLIGYLDNWTLGVDGPEVRTKG